MLDGYMGTQLSPQKGHSPYFRPTSVLAIGQTAAWIKMPLGTEVGLGPGDFVLDGDQSLHGKGHSTPTFQPTSINCGQTVAHLSNCCVLVNGFSNTTSA